LRILGISALYHDSAAVLYVDGELIAASQEERFTRIKHDERFPVNAINFCFEKVSFSIKDIDAIAFYDKPLLKFERILETHLSTVPKGLASFVTSMPIWMKEKMFFKKHLKRELKKVGLINWKKTELLFPEHHLSHGASAYYPSGFEDAAIVTIDGVGEWATTSISKGIGNQITVLKEIHFPHSLGLLYSAFTSFLGFKVNSGEYKLMGLAPYGNQNSKRTQDFISKIKSKLVSIKADGSFQLNLEYFAFTYSNSMCNYKKWTKIFGLEQRKELMQITNSYCDLAFAIQRVTEEIVLGLVKQAKKITGSENLCLAGGVALNCVSNGVIRRSNDFQYIYISPASGDAGGALGAALAANHIYYGKMKRGSYSPFSGPSFSKCQIKNELERLNANFKKVEDVCAETASLINAQKVVGWFQDEMEFGPRALGNRSILGDPRNPEMQRRINLKIKFREGFRPFAPSVMRELVSKYFEFEGESPFMLFVHKLKTNLFFDNIPSSIRERLYGKVCDYPAITHVDNSARIQTVSELDNPKYYSLLKAFYEVSGCGMLVNTSFNVRGEPIVCSPYDAYRCFMETNMDVLAIGDYLLLKEDQPIWEKDKNKFKLD